MAYLTYLYMEYISPFNIKLTGIIILVYVNSSSKDLDIILVL